MQTILSPKPSIADQLTYVRSELTAFLSPVRRITPNCKRVLLLYLRCEDTADSMRIIGQMHTLLHSTGFAYPASMRTSDEIRYQYGEQTLIVAMKFNQVSHQLEISVSFN